MAIQSKVSIPIPAIGIPDFVFKPRDVPLPESPLFISAEDSERFLSLSSYRDWSCRLAVGLKAYGVNVGDRVFLASRNTIYNTVVFMGAIMAGAIFVGFQATYSIEDMAKQLEQVDPKVILAAEDFMPKILKASEVASRRCEKVFLFDQRVHGSTSASHWTKLVADKETARDFTWESLNSRDAAMRTASLMYTSGSTGFPKGVEHSHYGIIASMVQARRTLAVVPGLNDGNSSAPLCYLSMSQVVAQVAACVHYPSLNQPIIVANRSDFASVIEYISKLQTTSLIINPSFLVAMNKRPEMRERMEEISSLRSLALTGSPVDYGQYQEFISQWTKKSGKTILIFSIYGMTELGGGAFTKSMDKEDGKTSLFPNIETKVIDFDRDEEVHGGTAGELCVRGPIVAKGYWQNMEATEKSFAKDGWLRTGDAATVDGSGSFSVLARVQDLIRVDNRIIVPSQMERVLLSHPHVQDAVVCGVSQTRDASLQETLASTGTSPTQKIRAYIVKDKDSNLNAQDVDDFMAQEAPTMQNLSGGVVFLDNIPQTADHKPNRRLLLEHLPSPPTGENGVRGLQSASTAPYRLMKMFGDWYRRYIA